jgi:hypothetical protein
MTTLARRDRELVTVRCWWCRAETGRLVLRGDDLLWFRSPLAPRRSGATSRRASERRERAVAQILRDGDRTSESSSYDAWCPLHGESRIDHAEVLEAARLAYRDGATRHMVA